MELWRPEPPPALLDRAGIARELGCSVAKIDRLCNEGMPFVRLGDTKRFRVQAVLKWLEAR